MRAIVPAVANALGDLVADLTPRGPASETPPAAEDAGSDFDRRSGSELGRRFQRLGAGARDLGRVILASQQTGIGTGYSRPLFVSAPAAGAATAAFDGRSEASTRYA